MLKGDSGDLIFIHPGKPISPCELCETFVHLVVNGIFNTKLTKVSQSSQGDFTRSADYRLKASIGQCIVGINQKIQFTNASRLV